jgi:hypothetical protein
MAKKVKIELDLDKETLAFIKKVSKLADVSLNQTISVLISMEIVRNERKKKQWFKPIKKAREEF